MQPKGLKKDANADSSAGSNNASKENDVVSIDDILFPKATVNRIAKNVLIGGGENDEVEKSQFILSKDSLTVIQRSSVVFISHLFHHALRASKSDVRKTVNAQDVMSALKSTGFNAYLPILEEELAQFTEKANLKRLLKQNKTEPAGEEDVDEDEDDLEEEVTKKAKANDGSVAKAPSSKAGVHDDDDEEDEDATTEAPDADLEEEDDDDTLDATPKPSQIIEREQKELEGQEPSEEEIIDDEDEDED